MARKKVAVERKIKSAKKAPKRRVIGREQGAFRRPPPDAGIAENPLKPERAAETKPEKKQPVVFPWPEKVKTACDGFLRALVKLEEEKRAKPGILVQSFEGRPTGFLFTEDVDDPPGWSVLMGRTEGFQYRHYPLVMASMSGAQEVLRGLTNEVKSVIVLAAFQCGRQSVLDEQSAKEP